ncbi:MAG TPA: outer membrane beta-barrel protein [Alphaproteobacteria bacterium]|nr:outer membrane beta-barrel protein [Alphaproteobacteria bacterium]
MSARRNARRGYRVACACVVAFGFASTAAAQTVTAPPVSSDASNPAAPPTRSDVEHAMPLGSWLVSPSMFLGGIYDSNVNQSATNKISSWGVRATPSFLAQTTDGILKSTLYGLADVRAYTASGASGADTVTANAGALEEYDPTPDLFIHGQADYLRQKDLFSSLGVESSTTSLNSTGVGLAPSVNPVSYNQFSGTAGAQKDFGRAFVGLDGSAVNISYDHTGAVSPNGTTYTGTGKGGFWFLPQFYVYTEGALDTRTYATSSFNSSGYRALAGVGSEQIGLFRGEAYGGYQAENFRTRALGASNGTTNSTLFGSQLHYYPQPYIDLSANVTETIGVSQAATASGAAAGDSTKVLSAIGQGAYTLSQIWGFTGRGGYIHTTYINNPRRDDAWTLGGTLSYSVWRDFKLTLDYQYLSLSSNVAQQSLGRNVVTFGVAWSY